MSNARNKLLRNRKQFGRCTVQGHGQNCFCEVMEDIQTAPFSRGQEKQEIRKEIQDQLIFTKYKNY